ncbi:10 TM acyl transferase domain found in Cas1p-domain-containing protein [Stachybotrys elegans]|uniref:10 TM acyl transferase domain found in Cas1p-domain-containing protein n=1 Tax=Stachybotrys elegans TaxID=80388 RepID=A0A8K0SZR7_9HYPO|nr:10 TM acyl transferase domain found in Cas1p-domain-containing protein [Stachybotrys elegans]
MIAVTTGRPLAILCAFALAVTLLLLALDQHDDDPYRCHALLRHGSWLDTPDFHGNRAPFSSWQPRGCMIRNYTRADIHRCVDGRRMVFAGDETASDVFWALAGLLERDRADLLRPQYRPDEYIETEFDSLHLVRIWDPTLKTDSSQSNLTDLFQILHDERGKHLHTSRQASPAFTFVSGGSSDVDSVNFKTALESLATLLQDERQPRFGIDPMDPVDGVGNQVFVAPVPPPFDDTSEATAKHKDVKTMHDMLATVETQGHLAVPWSFLALTEGQPMAAARRNDSDLHVVEAIAWAKANILLNLRCNARLDAMDGSPYDHNCCSDYSQQPQSQSQTAVLILAVAYLVACLLGGVVDTCLKRTESRGFFTLQNAIFAVALLACFFADRTQLMGKASKHFAWLDVVLLMIVALAIGLISIPPGWRVLPAHSGLATTEDDRPLSRDQTEEWKGWMQAFVLIYRWTAGPSDSFGLYIAIRLCVAAYLFLMSYGHAKYFFKTKDTSPLRIVTVILRINLFAWMMSYAMFKDLTEYYFVPLVTFWFLAISVIMAILPSWNTNLLRLSIKMALSVIIGVGYMHMGHVPYFLYRVFADVTKVDWDLRNWYFHVALDAPMVYLGILVAFASHTGYLESRLTPRLALGGLLSIMVYWAVCLGILDTESYNRVHPFVSFIPVLSYIALRNAYLKTRWYASYPFVWLGRHSLEIYLLQHHLFLAADGNGILTLGALGGNGGFFDRGRHILILLPILLCLSAGLNAATTAMVECFTYQEAGYGREQLSAEKSEMVPWSRRLLLSLLSAARHVLTLAFWRNHASFRLAAVLGFLILLNHMD